MTWISCQASWIIISMKAENNKYLIDVVPLTKIPMSSHQSFSYLSDVEIPSGTLVSIVVAFI